MKLGYAPYVGNFGELRERSCFIALLVALCVFAGCNDDRGPRASGFALDLDLVISPSPLVFESLAPGFSDSRSVSISNEGSSPVKVENVWLVGPEGAFELHPTDSDVELEPDESMEVLVDYRQVNGLPAGTVFVDTTHGTFTVPIRTVLGPPRISVTPEEIDFGWFSLGEVDSGEIRIVNEGGSTGNVTDAFLLGDPEFVLLEASATPPLSLQPGQAVRLLPAFRAEVAGSRSSTVVVSTDSGAFESQLSAEVRGLPCIEVSPREVTFGNIVVGAAVEQAVTISHCGIETDEPLQLQQLTLRAGNSGAFTLQPFELIELQPGEAIDATVIYAPQRLEFTDTATLRIVSDADNEPLIDVPLIGRGVERACEGLVTALCTIEGREDPPSADLAVIPLDTVTCEMVVEGTCPAVSFNWNLTSAPLDSTSLPATDGNLLSFFVDLAGSYTIEATAQFADGEFATPATIHIEAVPDEDLHVQLVWDNASDVDLHLLHPDGCWEDGRWDCHFRNRSPQWAEAGPEDNPSLDIDDTNGFGPENVNLDLPETGVGYRIGVHYWSDHGQGPARATLRIFVRGAILFEASRVLENSGDWWEVAEVPWPAAEIIAIDEVSSFAPSCP